MVGLGRESLGTTIPMTSSSEMMEVTLERTWSMDTEIGSERVVGEGVRMKVHSQLEVCRASLIEPESSILMKLPARCHVILKCLADMAMRRVRSSRALHCEAVSMPVVVVDVCEVCELWDAIGLDVVACRESIAWLGRCMIGLRAEFI